MKQHQYPSPELIWMISRRMYYKILWPRVRAHGAVSPHYHMVSHCDDLLRRGTTLLLSGVRYLFAFFVYNHYLEFTTRRAAGPCQCTLIMENIRKSFLITNKECPLFCTVNVGRPNNIQWNRDLSFRHRSFFRMYCSQFLVPN